MKKLIFGLIAALTLFASPALAQSGCAYITYGAVLTAGQWNSCFQGKANNFGYTPVNKAGDSMSGGVVLAAPTTHAGLTFQLGVPSAAANGETWMTSQGLFMRPNGTSLGPFNTPFYTGTSAPTTPITYSFWSNSTTASNVPISIYDGTQWVQLGILNATAHTWGPNGTAAIATRFVFTTAGAGTYTRTNSNVRQLLVRMCGGGGGGSGWNGATTGGTGGTTSFGSTTAIGGTGGTPGNNSTVGSGGAGGTGGSNTGATNPLRNDGGAGSGGSQSAAAFSALGGIGGASIFGGQGAFCSGGAGGITSAASGNGSGGGGGAGESVEFLVNTPGPSISLTVGAAGAASTGGSTNGLVGKVGAVMVEERY